jgi:threonine dehydrogenase-like Zn-dependent dehydrogenase
VVADFTGVPAAFPEGLQMVRKAGRHIIWGVVYPGGNVTLDLSMIVGKKAMIMGSSGNDLDDLRKVLELIETRRDRYPWDKMVSHTFKLQELNEAFKVANERNVTRVAIVP